MVFLLISFLVSCKSLFLKDFFLNLFLFIYFWLHWVFAAVCGLSPVVESGGCSAVVEQGPSCSAACGIFPGQGSNPCPPHRQADSQPLRHEGSPKDFFKSLFFFNGKQELSLKGWELEDNPCTKNEIKWFLFPWLASQMLSEPFKKISSKSLAGKAHVGDGDATVSQLP